MSSFLLAARAHAWRGVFPRGFEHVSAAAFAVLLLFASAPGALAHEFKAGDLEIGHPWSRATPPGAKVAGGYFTVTNKGSSPDRLLSISTDISDTAGVHEMGVKDGVMTMRPVNGGLEIPAGGKVELKPGGYHVMFVGLKRQPKQGEKFPATLTFEKAGNVKIEFLVEGMSEAGGMEDHAE
ncbi:conserved exported hypothetical protein [Mesorhizobium sp. ORS 3324]|nr:conserved exported hypothetical protein [Mesorhizobium sp. ORS 3324]